MLHVHDLVDYVSEEAVQAGRNAARYLLEGRSPEQKEIPLTVAGAVRYTVPCTFSPQRMEAETVVRFRVGRNLRDALVRVTADGKELLRRKRPVMAPGEMEQVKLKREWFTGQEKEIVVEALEAKEAQ